MDRPIGNTANVKLPTKRQGYTQEMTIGGIKMFLRTGEYPNGELAEIFITFAKQGTVVRGMADAFAIAVSLGLQHGVPLQKYVDTFVHTKFPPEGIVTGHTSIKVCTSFADAVVRDLAIHYLGKLELANVNNNLSSTVGHTNTVGDVLGDNSIGLVSASLITPSQETVGHALQPRKVISMQKELIKDDKYRRLAQDTANKLGEPVLLITNPPSGMEYSHNIPYVILEDLASDTEKKTNPQQFVPNT